LTGYYGQGRGTGTGTLFANGFDEAGKKRDSKDWYLQATYAIPGVGTKIGLSHGESELDGNRTEGGGKFENRMTTIGAYHPITKHLNLVAEYSHAKAKNTTDGDDESGKSKTVSLGAILFF